MIDYRLKDDYRKALDVVEKYVIDTSDKLMITDVTISKRMTRTLGNCYWNTTTGKARIVISYSLMDENYPQKLRIATLIHEILHAYFPREHHNKRWKKYANLISQKTEYTIERLANKEEMNALEKVRKDDYKYLIVCTQCGREVRKNRKSSIVDYPQLWRCGICGGTFKRVV